MMQHLSKEVMVPSHDDLPADACSSRDSHGTGLSHLSHRNHTGPPGAADSSSIEISLTPSPLPMTLGFRSLKPRLEQPSPSAFSFFAKPWIPEALPRCPGHSSNPQNLHGWAGRVRRR